jgi:hypothetical protein
VGGGLAEVAAGLEDGGAAAEGAACPLAPATLDVEGAAAALGVAPLLSTSGLMVGAGLAALLLPVQGTQECEAAPWKTPHLHCSLRPRG